MIILLCLFFAFATTTEDCEGISIPNIINHLRELDRIASVNGGNRAAGTDGYRESVSFILKELISTNFKVQIQDFVYNTFEVIGVPRLWQTSPVENHFVYQTDFRVMTGSGSGKVSSVATKVPNVGCTEEDYVNFPPGNIALILRGVCPFNEKVRLAEEASASAIIIYNSNTNGGGLFSGSVTSKLPVLSISYWLGITLGIGGQIVRLNIDTETIIDVAVTSNILAETLTGDENNIIMVGSHLDSVPGGPGINDNGSGTSTNLEMALTTFRCLTPKNKIRFAWWGAEELGLLGSYAYVNDLVKNNPQELKKIALVINIDMLGSPNYFYGIYNGTGASPDIRDKCVQIQREFEQYIKARSEPYMLTPFDGRSDYGPFIEVGVPAGGLFSGAEVIKNSTGRTIFGGFANAAYDPCYHDYCDSIENISEKSIDVLASAAYQVMKRFATDTLIDEKFTKDRKTPLNLQYEQHPNALSHY